ncbi:diaminopimelate epimerase [Thiohalobacter thiocyanaticus]|uniref:Diaminopimelate epimerase n=1 Tax=Thiohalobacter thiocyanaticus TaxID=585455 RepID=A0A426QJE7_9GAMM|nr:diaminopimelate epimerase [Thiohalobacter thiocyanaticus]RRQ21883.1 diaminopimelate epimerase [Thiohalobacter thiocyanaticus]
MNLRFTKMHGLGNDFVVIDAVNQSVALSPDQVRWLADRHRGIGCDQLLLVEPASDSAADFRYRIYNADGGEVEQCGNGARCFMRFVHDQGLTDRRALTVQTLGGPIELQLEDDGQVTVDMGPPRLEPAAIPFQAPARASVYPIEVDGQEYRIGALSMGNPHAVLTVEDIERTPVAELGPRIEHHPRFPNRVNVGFMQILASNHIRLRVHERGAGETCACGTGACAAVVAGRLQGRLDERVRVSLPGGDLVISWPGENASVFMTGPAVSVFEGTIPL